MAHYPVTGFAFVLQNAEGKLNEMQKTMFCPKCGADAQSAESYCTRCGEWLPDIDAFSRVGLFRKRTREEKIRKMRVLEAVSAGLSLTAAAIILAVLLGRADTQLLYLAFSCCLITVMYQAVNFYLGHKLQHKIEQSRSKETAQLPHQKVRVLGSGESTAFVNQPSVVENTTEHLEAVPRKAER